MMFLKPEYFLMLLIPLLIFFYFIMSNKSALNVYFDEKVLEKLRFDSGALGLMGRNILLFVALLMMIIALARPVLPKGDLKIKTKSIDMMVALDISKSMMAGDFYPSRLAFAKGRFMEFLDSFKEANVGVIAFSSEGFLVSPMTQDTSTVKYLVNNLSLDSMTLKGTDLMIPIEKGKAFLADSKDKIIIIFTDGGDNEDFSAEIAKVKEYGESIYVYAVATPEGAPIKDKGEAIKDKAGNIVISRLNEKIKMLAIESGGAYIEGHYDDGSIALMVKDIKKKFKMREQKEKKIQEFQELFYYPLALALLFLLFVFHSFPRRASTAIMIGLLSTMAQVPLEAKMFDFQDISKAEKAYESGEWESASTHFKNVVKSNKSAESIYDLANTQYQQGKYKEALKTYANISTQSPSLQYKRAFNQGNAHFKLKAYEKAIKAYEEAAKIKSEEDLTHNLELAKKMLKKKKEQEKKQKKNQDDKKKKDQKDKDGKKGDKEKKDQKKKSQEGKDKKDKDKKQEEQQKQQAKKKDEMSKKEEKMWQQHLERMKPKTMPMKMQTKAGKRSVNEKPW